MKTARASTLALVIAASWPLVMAGECLDSGRKPIKVSGTLCGTVTISNNGEPLAEFQMKVTNDEPPLYAVVATVKTDAKGNFTFGPLPKGKYRLWTPGFNSSYPSIEVTKSSSTCGRQLFLNAQIGGDCPSYVTTKLPRR
jgi:hypothetical protein